MLWHVPVIILASFFSNLNTKPADCYDTCGLYDLFDVLIGIYLINDFIGLPLDIFNIYAIFSDEKI